MFVDQVGFEETSDLRLGLNRHKYERIKTGSSKFPFAAPPLS